MSTSFTNDCKHDRDLLIQSNELLHAAAASSLAYAHQHFTCCLFAHTVAQQGLSTNSSLKWAVRLTMLDARLSPSLLQLQTIMCTFVSKMLDSSSFNKLLSGARECHKMLSQATIACEEHQSHGQQLLQVMPSSYAAGSACSRGDNEFGMLRSEGRSAHLASESVRWPAAASFSCC